MSNHRKLLLLAAATLAAAACQKSQDDQNLVISNEIPANADVETLPPDESGGTTTGELENGVDDADVGDLDNNSD